MTPERGHWHVASLFQRKLNVNTGCHAPILTERQLEKCIADRKFTRSTAAPSFRDLAPGSLQLASAKPDSGPLRGVSRNRTHLPPEGPLRWHLQAQAPWPHRGSPAAAGLTRTRIEHPRPRSALLGHCIHWQHDYGPCKVQCKIWVGSVPAGSHRCS
jgi:hypothetical protein